MCASDPIPLRKYAVAESTAIYGGKGAQRFRPPLPGCAWETPLPVGIQIGPAWASRRSATTYPRAGAGGGRDRGDPKGGWPAPSLGTARCVTGRAWTSRSLNSKTATCLAQNGRLFAQRLEESEDITDQRPRPRSEGPRLRSLDGGFCRECIISCFGDAHRAECEARDV
jgi:hypothetical protein